MSFMTRERKATVAALGAGLLFGAGLVVGGMTQPSKVIGFLDVTGAWDPSLAFVMGGAIAVFMPLLRLITRRAGPLFGGGFGIPTRRDIDGKLVLGGALFGVGWGLAGYCPGPGITSLASLAPSAWLFVAAMVVGFGLMRGYDYLVARRAEVRAPVLEK